MRTIKVNKISFNVNHIVPSWPAFWDRVEDGSWEPETFALMDRLTPEWRWVDIGAWIGPTVLYAAKKCGVVDAYECDPTALAGLRANLSLNSAVNVMVHPFALGATNGKVEMWTDRLGNSETSIFPKKHRLQSSLTVPVRDALEVFLEKGYADDDKTIVKMDVEGSEFVILPRLAELMAKSKCQWSISYHEIAP